MIRKALWVFLMSLMLASVGHAATYWVSTASTGDGNNGCNASATPLTTTAKRTIDNAWNCLSAGDTLMVRGGTYAGLNFNNSRGGTSGNPKTLKPAPGETVVLDAALTTHNGGGVITFWGLGANYITLDGTGGVLKITDSVMGPPDHGSLQPTTWPCQNLWTPVNGACNGLTPGTDSGTNIPCAQSIYNFVSARRRGLEFDRLSSITDRPHHIRVLNVEITRLGQFGLWGNVDDLEVFNSHIHNLDLYGSYIAGYRHWWHNNHVHDNRSVGLRFGSDGNPPDPIEGKMANGVIENNLIHDNYGRIFHISGNANDSDLDTGGYGLICYGCSNNLIKNNVVYNNSWDDVWGNTCHVWGIWVMDRVTGANQVYNNTVVGHNPTSGLVDGPGLTNATFGNQNTIFRNNIVYQNKNNIDPAANSVFSNNLCNNADTGCTVIGNPNFINPAGGNYQLQQGSPAIDRGQPLVGFVPTDILGVSRPVGPAYDIGAYEFNVAPLSTYSVTRNLDTVAGGSNITASWTVTPGPGQTQDWIGLVLAGADAGGYVILDGAGNQAWTFTNGLTTGNFTIAAPLQAGTYEFMYCVNNTYACDSRSAPFTVTVTAPGPTGFMVRSSRWHKADVPQAFDANACTWIEGENANIRIRPGGKARYRTSIGYEGSTPAADFYPLYCTFDGTHFTRLSTSCADFPLCIGTDTQKDSGDSTTRLLTLPAGYAGLSGFFVVDSINTALTKQPADKQVFEMEYSIQSSATLAHLGDVAQCQARHNDGTPLQYLASSSLIFSDGVMNVHSGAIRSGRLH